MIKNHIDEIETDKLQRQIQTNHRVEKGNLPQQNYAKPVTNELKHPFLQEGICYKRIRKEFTLGSTIIKLFF